MIKTALLATAICFAFVLPASAAYKCEEASLIQMRKDIDAMTDKEKQAKSVESWDAAMAAFKENNADACSDSIGSADKSMGNADAGNNNGAIGSNGGDTSTNNGNGTIN